MKFVSRAQWGARDRRSSSSIGSTKGVTLHWEGPHMGSFGHEACAGKVRGIQRFHMDDRGWSDIAYNLLTCPHGYVFEGRGVGNMSAANGWEQVNDDWYAVCYLGGQGDPFTDEAKAATVDAVRFLRSKGAGPAVNGHRDHKATECPGGVIHAWLKTVNFNAAPDPIEPEDEMADYANQLNDIQSKVNALLERDKREAKTATRRHREERASARQELRELKVQGGALERVLDLLDADDETGDGEGPDPQTGA